MKPCTYIGRFGHWLVKACEQGYQPRWVKRIHDWIFMKRLHLKRRFGLREVIWKHIRSLRDHPDIWSLLGDIQDKSPSIYEGMFGFNGDLYFEGGIRDIWYRDPNWNEFRKFNITESVLGWYHYRHWLRKHRTKKEEE